MLNNLDLIFKEFQNAVREIKDQRQLEKIRIRFLGRNGLVTAEAKKISSVSFELKREFGSKVNCLKDKVNEEIKNVKVELEYRALSKKLRTESIDVTLPGRAVKRGKIHPISHTINLIKHILYSMGFEYIDGPDIENDWNNFTALNIPVNHPARQLHDTFYIKKSSNNEQKNKHEKDIRLLRTHTSTVQIRHMLKNKPPLKIFSVGKVYRSDHDVTHTPMFHQCECLVVDTKSSVKDLQACLKIFLKLFFNTDQFPIRFRTSYFPFTEPSFEVDIKCDRSNKKEIKIGLGNDWLEILGCGIINRKVLENAKVDSDEYQGFAIGVGIERLAMLKYNISDLRSFFEGDLRWLQHYGF